VDNTAGGRDRNTASDQRLDTFIHMQPSGANYRWEFAVPDGYYRVTIAAGDPNPVFDSTHSVRAEGKQVVGPFVPTSSVRQRWATRTVGVVDGRLTVDAVGGTNTKIAYIDIEQVDVDGPYFTSISPSAAESNVNRATSVVLTPSVPVDPATVNADTLVVTDPAGHELTGSYNSDAAGGVVNFTPSASLAMNTRYHVVVAGLKTPAGVAFPRLDYFFTTGATGTPVAPISFTRSKIGDVPGATALTVGPDNALYVATAVGQIFRYPLRPGGSVAGGRTQLARDWRGQRTITGLEFDPASTASNMKLYVSHGFLGISNAPHWTGKISVLTKTQSNFDTRRDVIIGLPRSIKDHLNNGIQFGPDGKLYIAQGSMNGYGAPDAAWGNRPETKLSGAILQADVRRIAGTLDVKTAPGGTYNPDAAGALVKVYAGGTRNAYDVLWHSNGSAYTAVNESAAGNTPAGPNNRPPALTGLGAGNDFFAKIVPGRYYGHPNPSRGDYTLNGGNPTQNPDYFEVPQYPVGTPPQANWQPPLHDLGEHRSPNGLCEYTSPALGPEYRGMVVQTEFSSGDDLLGLFLDSQGNVRSVAQIASGFNNPIDVVMGPFGVLYVAEFGAQTDDMSGGQVTLLRPNPS
jgi:glucose/arabinose dehydrogenase